MAIPRACTDNEPRLKPERGTVKHQAGAGTPRDGSGTPPTVEAAATAPREARLDDAERLYLAVLQHDRHHAAALHGLGLLRAQQGRLGDAIKQLRRAVEQAPRWADAHN